MKDAPAIPYGGISSVPLYCVVGRALKRWGLRDSGSISHVWVYPLKGWMLVSQATSWFPRQLAVTERAILGSLTSTTRASLDTSRGLIIAVQPLQLITCFSYTVPSLNCFVTAAEQRLPLSSYTAIPPRTQVEVDKTPHRPC